MKSFLYLFLTLIFLSSCKPGIPKDIIQPDDMALVLTDIHLVDGYISNVTPDSAKIIAASYYNGVYKKFNIDSAKFNKSMDYYNVKPAIMDDIYKKVTATLTKQKAFIIKTDSLAAVKRDRDAKKKLKTDSTKRSDSLSRVRAQKKIDSLKKVSDKKLEELKKTAVKRKKLSASLTKPKKSRTAKI